MVTQRKTKKVLRKRVKKQWLKLSLAIVFISVAGLVITAFVYQRVYAQRIYPGVKIGRINLSGKTVAQATTELKAVKNEIYEKGLEFKYQDKIVTIGSVTISPTDPDLSYEILSFDLQSSVNQAYQIGRRGSFWQNLLKQAQSLIFGKHLQIFYYLNQKELEEILRANFSELESPAQNALLKIEEGKIIVTDEKDGYTFDYQKALQDLLTNISTLDFKTIEMVLIDDKPEIKKAQTKEAVGLASQILDITPITFKADSYWWKIHQPQFAPWLEFQLTEDNQVTVGFAQASTTEFLLEIAKDFNIEALDAKFKLEGNRVTEFQASRDGRKIDIQKSYQKINQTVVKEKLNEVELVVETTPAKVTTGDVNELGIKELIGRGISNFAGSPRNRRHNIAVGAKTLNGILIEPGEEFSLLEALGEVDAEHGYKPELVIKGNRTIPEYGGGLCQIGTTTFRAALRSGLPITQRQPHSYRVVYYEPAGMDATIYNPSPDVRFVNDTGAHILFTTRIEGNDLIFEFYGTKDGREIVIEPDPPAIYNITSPGEPRYVETDELEPGEKKKIESSHYGADTHFKYTVTYPDGEVKEVDFYSHYVAWPEVWLVGKESEIATSTEEVLEQ